MNRQHPRVLIVEDESTLRHVLAKLFIFWHWEAMEADGLQSALELLEIPFDLIVLDLMLPDGDGIEVLRSVRSRNLGPTVVISSAKPLHSMQAVLELGPDMVLQKPFVLDQLESMSKQILTRFKPAGQ